VRAWTHFDKLNHSGGVNELAQLIRYLPDTPTPAARRAAHWAGKLREFSAVVAAPERRPPSAAIEALDAAVAARGGEIARFFQQGQADVQGRIANFDRQVASAAADPTEQLRLKFDRLSLRHYASFSPDAAAQQAVASLDVE
jgi:hypothetical protein